MATNQQNAQALTQANDVFLQYAPDTSMESSVSGILASGSSGGSTALYALNPSTIPRVPMWCTEIEVTTTVSVQLSVPASGSFTVSPFAPYCGLSSQLTLAGAPPWVLMEHTPWYLDVINTRRGFDPGYSGLGNNSATPFSSNRDQGPSSIAPAFGASPGSTITNTATTTATYNHTWTWTDTIRLQRRRKSLVGSVPFGDPKNRPAFKLMLNPLIGTTPEQNLYVGATSGVTAVTTAVSNTNIIFKGNRIDVVPQGTQVPSPTVLLGLTVNTYSPAISNSGQILPIPHQDAMLYNYIHHILVNDQNTLRADYFGTWLTQEQKSARFEYDASQNTFARYFKEYHDRLETYPITGVYTADMVGGDFPDLPAETPYIGIMTPDAVYANNYGIVPTPNMQTAIRIPSGTSINQAYVRIYSFGLVEVPY